MSLKKGVILLVEDEEPLRETLSLNLEMEGYEVMAVGDGTEALDAVAKAHYDLIIMDVMMPEMDGITATETLRIRNYDIPILILSAKNAGADRIAGLKKGADDYLTKPFHLEELLLRTEKLIEKNKKSQQGNRIEEIFEFGGNKIYFGTGLAITHIGTEISLSKKEVMLMRLFAESAGEIVSREKILQTVWGYQVYPTTRTIDNFILSFRKYFEKDSKNPVHFHSVRGTGYRFTASQIP